MVNESIFSFLTGDINFKQVHKTCLELEKAIANEMYDSALSRSRVAIEELVEIIIVKDEMDSKLSKKFYKKGKHTSISIILNECSRNGYISKHFYNSLKSFIKDYGNAGSHKNKENFTLKDVKPAHELIFDFSLNVFQRFERRFKKDYVFDLSYLEGEKKHFTKDEADEIIKDTHINEVSTDSIIEEIKNQELFLTKDQFQTLIEPITHNVNDISNVDYITQDNLDSVLSGFDDSIKKDIFKTIDESQKQQINDITETISNLEENQISMDEINKMIEKNNDEVKNELLLSIKDVAGDLIKEYLSNIAQEFNSTPIIDDDIIIEASNYEVIEIGETYEIKEIEEIIGIPDKCPKCNTKLQPGSTKCDNCGYDLFEIINKRCPKCGKRIPIGSKYCIRCGNDLEFYKCKKCGFENNKDSKFCTNCGADLNE